MGPLHGGERQHLRKLAVLGVAGNQPAVAGYCETTVKEDSDLIESVLAEMAGSITRIVKLNVSDRLEKEGGQRGGTKIRLRKSRIALSHTVRWKRAKATNEDADSFPNGYDDEQNDRPTYKYRILSFNSCGQRRERPAGCNYVRLKDTGTSPASLGKRENDVASTSTNVDASGTNAPCM